MRYSYLLSIGLSLLALSLVLVSSRTEDTPLTWIAYTSEQAGGDSIYVMETNGANPHRVTYAPEDACCAEFSPDGGWIAYHSFRDSQIHLVRPDGVVNRHFLLPVDKATNIYWSTDSEWLIFYGEIYGTDGSVSGGYYRVQHDGSDFQQLTARLSAYAPALGDNWLIYSSGPSNSLDLYRINLDGTNIQNLTDDDVVNRYPALSPDRQWLAFLDTDASGLTTISRMRPDGSQREAISTPLNNICCLSWSSDSEWIVFSVREPGTQWQIVRISVADRQVKPIFFASTSNAVNAWDGNWMIFERLSSRSNLDLYRLNIENSTQYRLTNHPGTDSGAVIGRLSSQRWRVGAMIVGGLFAVGMPLFITARRILKVQQPTAGWNRQPAE
ncbi:MAG: DUF5050 domain-containing protein [Chloroflexi bacterium]|nr:DUF5050 domain-containing protein [Chloroflexota bacterium]